MAATRTRSSTSSNATPQAGDAVATAARKSTVPLLVAGGTAAGLAGGLALGGRRRRGLSALIAPRRRVLGVPLGRRNGLVRTAKALGTVAAQLGSATDQVATTTGEVRQVREQLDKANRRSPIEVLVDALTHRRGAHKREGG
jgi:hypothetical protein